MLDRSAQRGEVSHEASRKRGEGGVAAPGPSFMPDQHRPAQGGFEAVKNLQGLYIGNLHFQGCLMNRAGTPDPLDELQQTRPAERLPPVIGQRDFHLHIHVDVYHRIDRQSQGGSQSGLVGGGKSTPWVECTSHMHVC